MRATEPARPPSVEMVLAAARVRLDRREHGPVLAIAREVIAAERARLGLGASPDTPRHEPKSAEALANDVIARVEALEAVTGPEQVINATGVVIHTNLGRAAWPAAAIDAAVAAASHPLFLELDRGTGRRGRRYREAEEHLLALTGAEDALIVNNNAAALGLAVGLAGRGGVAVSRGELVEIGGGVRIPDIVRRAGARLVEVGTTNRTRVADFEEVLAPGRARLVLRVHPSNFRQSGFVETPDARELARVAHAHGALVVDDLGSGALLDTAAFGLPHEPMPEERLAAGADVVTFSGDKLVGGPQAGYLVGSAATIGRLRRDPLARAMRPDKVTLAAAAATLALYRAGSALQAIPIWRQIGAPVEELRSRAEAIARSLSGATVVETRATVGGGALTEETLPSVGLRLRAPSSEALLRRLRLGTPAVVGRVEDDGVILDLRTIDPADDSAVARAIAHALSG